MYMHADTASSPSVGLQTRPGPRQLTEPRRVPDGVPSSSVENERTTGVAVVRAQTVPVSVQWRVVWSSNVGTGGTLPSENISAPVTVTVDELQALVG